MLPKVSNFCFRFLLLCCISFTFLLLLPDAANSAPMPLPLPLPMPMPMPMPIVNEHQQQQPILPQIPQWHCLRYFKHDLLMMRRCRHVHVPTAPRMGDGHLQINRLNVF